MNPQGKVDRNWCLSDSIGSVRFELVYKIAAVAYDRGARDALLGKYDISDSEFTADTYDKGGDSVSKEDLILQSIQDVKAQNEKLIDKIDKVKDEMGDIRTRIVIIEKKDENIWKSKTLWIPVVCSVIVAVAGVAVQLLV